MRSELQVYVGTYTDSIVFGTGEEIRAAGEGIYQLHLADDGAMQIASVEKGIRNPSYLSVGADNRFLYAVNELKSYEGAEGGSVSAFRIDDRTGKLELLNRQPSGGVDPCHARVDPSGRNLVVSNYSSGVISVFPVHSDGSLGNAATAVRHHGSSVNAERQADAHAHSTIFDRTGGLMFAADLGMDRVVGYRFDADSGSIEELPGGGLRTKPGRGPRHMAFTSDSSFFYVVNELDSTLTACRFAPETGQLEELDTLSTLPSGFTGESACAEVAMHPTESFIYVSNRGHDSIALFRRDSFSGRVALAGHTPTGGGTPRHFAISPDGKLLLVANQTTDSVVSFRIDPASGVLEPTGRHIEVGSPSCICFRP